MGSFDWDPGKYALNQLQHGVSLHEGSSHSRTLTASSPRTYHTAARTNDASTASANRQCHFDGPLHLA